jgi:hypothetical protein
LSGVEQLACADAECVAHRHQDATEADTSSRSKRLMNRQLNLVTPATFSMVSPRA